MIKYKKSFSYVCFAVLILGCSACKREVREDTSQVCALNKQPQTSVETEKPIVSVILDDKAIAAFSKQKTKAVYCVTMGAS